MYITNKVIYLFSYLLFCALWFSDMGKIW